MIINRCYWALTVVLIAVVSCRGQAGSEFNLPINGTLLYVEALQGEGQISSNPFGDLVLLDSKNQQRRLLSRDKFYYAFPNLTHDGNSVVFESKRSDHIDMLGLSTDSDIYRMDMSTKKIVNYNEEVSAIIGESIGVRVTHPSLTPSGNKLAVVRWVDSSWRLSYIDIENKKIIDLTTDDNFLPNSYSTLSWSEDEQYLVFSRTVGFLTSTVLLGIEEKQPYVISPAKNENLEELASCIAGNWMDSNHFIYHCKRQKGNQYDIFKFNIDSQVSTFLRSFDGDSLEMKLKSLKISKEGDQILFIAVSTINAESDIWRMQLDNGELSRITSNGSAKEWLKWYRSNK